MNDDPIVYRKVTTSDTDQIVRLRRAMFEDMGYSDTDKLNASDHSCYQYFNRSVPSGEYFGWIAENAQGRAIATGGAVIHEYPPSPFNLSGRTGYIMNIYTDPEYRRTGIARKILERLLDDLKDMGITLVTLHATQDGSHLYSQYGFSNASQMRLNL